MDYRLKERSLSYSTEWDVIVVGGGPAGCAAATASARAGAKTLLIESTGILGGMGTSGLVPAWCPFSDKEKIIYKGIAQEVFDACKQGMPHVNPDELDWVSIDSERLKRIYDDLVVNAGAAVLFNTFICGVETKGGNIEAIIAANKSGLSVYGAKVYIDCTGDADLAAFARAEFVKGDEKTGETQMATHCFVLTNVDEYAFLNGPNVYGGSPESPIHKILASGKYPQIIDTHLCCNMIGPRTVGFNACHILNVDSTQPESVSQALIKGRKIANAMCEALAEFYPKAFANAFLVETSPVMGIRESRRIIGDYMLCEADYLRKASFKDEICRCSYYIDMHRTANIGDKDAEKKFLEKYPQYKKGESFGLPYRCLTPKNLKNVLVAGRSISCTRPLQGSTRVMPVCLAMGQAAGTASAMAARSQTIDMHHIDTTALRNQLKKDGAYLP